MPDTTLTNQQLAAFSERITVADKTLRPFFEALEAINLHACQDDPTTVTPKDREREQLAHDLTHAVYLHRTGLTDSKGRHGLWAECVREAKIALQHRDPTCESYVAKLEQVAALAATIIAK